MQTVETSSGNQQSRSANRNWETNSPPYGYGGRRADQMVFPVRIIMSPNSSSKCRADGKTRARRRCEPSLPGPPSGRSRWWSRNSTPCTDRLPPQAPVQCGFPPRPPLVWWRDREGETESLLAQPADRSRGRRARRPLAARRPAALLAAALLLAGCGGGSRSDRGRTVVDLRRSRSRARASPPSSRSPSLERLRLHDATTRASTRSPTCR